MQYPAVAVGVGQLRLQSASPPPDAQSCVRTGWWGRRSLMTCHRRAPRRPRPPGREPLPLAVRAWCAPSAPGCAGAAFRSECWGCRVRARGAGDPAPAGDAASLPSRPRAPRARLPAPPGPPAESGVLPLTAYIAAGCGGQAGSGQNAGRGARTSDTPGDAGRQLRTPRCRLDAPPAQAALKKAFQPPGGACPTSRVRSRSRTFGSCTSSQSTNWRNDTRRTSLLPGHPLQRLLDRVHVDAAVPLLEVVADVEGRAVRLVRALEARQVRGGGLFPPAGIARRACPWWCSSTGWRGCCSPSTGPRRSARGTGCPGAEGPIRPGACPATSGGRRARRRRSASPVPSRWAAGCPGRADTAYGRRRALCGSRRAAGRRRASGCWCAIR